MIFLLQMMLETDAPDWTGVAALGVSGLAALLVFVNQYRQNTIAERQAKINETVSEHELAFKMLIKQVETLEKYEKGFRVFYRVLQRNNLLDDPDVRALNGLVAELEKKKE